MQKHKCSPQRVLPRVTTQTWKGVLREWKNEEEAAGFVANLVQRLEVEHPEIAQFLLRAFTRFEGKAYPRKAMLIYACSVYRMLEVETKGQLPIVSVDIGAPLQEEFMRDPKGFYVKTVLDIERKNPNVMEAILPFIIPYQMAGDDEAAAWVPFVGVVLYKMLESQIESNRLSKSLGI